MRRHIFTAPEPIASSFNWKKRLFLGGSIEMGEAKDWQSIFTGALAFENYAMYNPRRTEWNKDWEQSISNPAFYQQVDWELRALEASTHILIYLQGGTISPISLMEVGLYATSGKLHIICEKDFHRRGNIEVICERYRIPLYSNLPTNLNVRKFIELIIKD